MHDRRRPGDLDLWPQRIHAAWEVCTRTQARRLAALLTCRVCCRGSYAAAEAKIAVNRLKKMNSVRVGMESVLPQAVPQQLEDGIPSPAVLPVSKLPPRQNTLGS
eukprot:2126792-Rhodomonas_salina.2